MLFSVVGLLFLVLLLNSSLTKEEVGFQMSSLASLMNLLSNTPLHLVKHMNDWHWSKDATLFFAKAVNCTCEKLLKKEVLQSEKP